tara:strand:+ start:412 stop:1008 length:597 start_codon:yes stop_codon:yes gene_type:complete
MALTANKFILPNGTPTIDNRQATQSSSYGDTDLDRAVAGVGWANYVDSVYTSGSPLELRVGNSYAANVAINGTTSTIVSQWPAGVTEPWDTSTNKLIATNDGDSFDFRLRMTAQGGASPVQLTVAIDIGGTQGVIFRKTENIAKGATTETDVTISSDYFTGSTFITNGGTITVSTADGTDDLDLWGFQILLFRKFVGR